MNQTPQTQTKHIQLTTKQGLLLLAVIVVVFVGLASWKLFQYPQSFTGKVVAGDKIFVPFGCQADKVGQQLTVPIRPDPEPQGFHEENRAIIVTATFPNSAENGTFEAPITSLAWRNERKEVAPLTCTGLNGSVSIKRVRRGGQTYTRRNLWTGNVDAACEIPGLGNAEINLEMKNCD